MRSDLRHKSSVSHLIRVSKRGFAFGGRSGGEKEEEEGEKEKGWQNLICETKKNSTTTESRMWPFFASKKRKEEKHTRLFLCNFVISLHISLR